MNRAILTAAVFSALLAGAAWVEAASGSGARTRTSSVPINGQSVSPGSVSTSLVKADVIDAGVLNVEGAITHDGTITYTGTAQAWISNPVAGINKTIAWAAGGVSDWTYSNATGRITIGGGINFAGPPDISANGRTCTLNGGTPSTCTATVTASAVCQCTPVGGTAVIAAAGCAVGLSGTTLTATSGATLTNVVNIWCDR